jgi:phosphoribosylglycinamide formyltransferase 2
MLLGSGELGKEVAIECQRLGIEVVACDRYANAPAMQVAHRSHVLNMLDPVALREVIERERPDYVVPEVEAIATQTLVELEAEGVRVVPCARATQLTMNREGIRRLAAETLQLHTSPYAFAEDYEAYAAAVSAMGYPCIVKPVMSSSGKGQSLLRSDADLEASWRYAQEGGRAGGGKVIVEGFVAFDYEITLLTVSAIDGIHFCAPIGHRQEAGDYRESWQPQAMSAQALAAAKDMAGRVVSALGGHGLFGVELFVQGDEVIFSEVSPRPHDTGMVTLVSQSLSEFALHVRAFLGLPVRQIPVLGSSASAVILASGQSKDIRYTGIAAALDCDDVQLRLFAKPDIDGQRRLGVALARGETVEAAVSKAKSAAAAVKVLL